MHELSNEMWYLKNLPVLYTMEYNENKQTKNNTGHVTRRHQHSVLYVYCLSFSLTLCDKPKHYSDFGTLLYSVLPIILCYVF